MSQLHPVASSVFLDSWTQQLPSGKLTYLWKITIFNGKIHYKWPFPKVMLNYQSASLIKEGEAP